MLLHFCFGDWVGGDGGQGPGEDWGKAHVEELIVFRKGVVVELL
jgi:hypothetical protein